MKIKDITSIIEDFAPLSLQESYDNAGLIIGDRNMTATGALLTLDITEAVVDEAIEKNYNLIISHHPILFKGLKKITGSNFEERIVIKAIKNDIAIYAAHTNIDNVKNGVNGRICDLLKLQNCKILSPKKGNLKKLVTYVPEEQADLVRKAIFDAGAGTIGNYDNCSFNTQGEGTFRGGSDTNPYVGKSGESHIEKEIRIETIFPAQIQSNVISSMLNAHPYEEVAYDIYSLDNKNSEIGSGMIGTLNEPIDEIDFLKLLKKTFNIDTIRHTKLFNKKIKKVAVCGGSGDFLLKTAIGLKADIYISGDFKYHNFFDAENNIIIADIGHFESEQFTKNIFYDILTKKIPKFALSFSTINTNPVVYFS